MSDSSQTHVPPSDQVGNPPSIPTPLPPESQPNLGTETPPPPPTSDPIAPAPSRSIRRRPLKKLALLLFLAFGYFVYRYFATASPKTQPPAPSQSPSSPLPSPTPVVIGVEYSNSEYGYSLTVLDGWKAVPQNKSGSLVVLRPTDSELSPILLNARKNNDQLTPSEVIDIQVGKNYPRDEKTIGAVTWLVYEGSSGGYKNTNYVAVVGNNYYLFSVSQGDPDFPIAFLTMLSTVRFSSSENLSCPANGWQDCMPSPEGKTASCSAEAISWYEKNCPDFQGIAN